MSEYSNLDSFPIPTADSAIGMESFFEMDPALNYTSALFLGDDANAGTFLGLPTKISGDVTQKWVLSVTGCLLVSLCGVLPLSLVHKAKSGQSDAKTPAILTATAAALDQKTLRQILSFAVGSLLGNVFLHLLPEAWAHAHGSSKTEHDIMSRIGFWVLAGLLSFVACEKLVANFAEAETEAEAEAEPQPHKNAAVAGYLNLLANCFDNFTHGVAVAGSFTVSPRLGSITTAAILLHEIPHELGDFAILLRSGFDPWSAAKAQLSTALVGLAGAIFALSCDSIMIGDCTWWILPFTAGCFIQIAMSNILPDLMLETDLKESCIHFVLLLFGIGLMGIVVFVESSNSATHGLENQETGQILSTTF